MQSGAALLVCIFLTIICVCDRFGTNPIFHLVDASHDDALYVCEEYDIRMTNNHDSSLCNSCNDSAALASSAYETRALMISQMWLLDETEFSRPLQSLHLMNARHVPSV